MVDVDEFIAIKSHRAKGKRLSTYEIATLRFIEPEVEDEELEDEPLMDEEMGEDISADPNVDYNERAEAAEVLGASQLNLF